MPKARCPIQILPLLNRGRLSGALTIPGALSQWNCSGQWLGANAAMSGSSVRLRTPGELAILRLGADWLLLSGNSLCSEDSKQVKRNTHPDPDVPDEARELEAFMEHQ